jgi:LysM repeat protein
VAELNCPFLGLRDDPETCKLFPSEYNCCRRAQPVEPVTLAHQAAFCLSAQHFRCPVFIDKTIGPLPAPISAVPRPTGNWRWAAVSLTAFALAILLGFIGWQSGLPALPLATDASTPVFTAEPSPLPAMPVVLPSETPPPPPPTNTPEPPPSGTTATAQPTEATGDTATSSVCVSPSGWVIYTVQRGDTLSALSAALGVSMADLQKANCLWTNTNLFTGQRLYVPSLPHSTAGIPTITPARSTETPVPPSATPEPPTLTPEPPTLTPEPPTLTPTLEPSPTDTPVPTDTPPPPTDTSEPPPPSP